MKKTFLLTVSLLSLMGLLLVSCSPVAPSQATPVPATQVSTLPSPVPPTAAPSPTTLPGKVLLIAPADASAGAEAIAGAKSAQAALAELSSAAGLVLETRPGLQKEDLSADVKIVVALLPLANLAELAAAAPQVQFLAVSQADLAPAANLTVIRERLENQAFVAGFITVLLSTDYRSGALLPSDGPIGDKLKEAFTNGARYYCGVCAPGWPLNLYYPQVAALPAASDGPAWQAAAAGLFDAQKAEVYFLAPEAARPEVIAYLQGRVQADKTVLIVGAQTPPDALLPQWAATVRFDLESALRQAWPDVLAGKGGAALDAALLVDRPTPALLGEGRIRLVNDLIGELKAGTVYPFTVPQQ